MNFHETAPPRWSPDSSVLLWKVNGKWNPDALVLLKIEDNRLKWHIDLLRTAQEAVLVRTRDAAPEQYLSAKKANSGNGRAFPDGFTIDVTTDGEDTKTVSLPLVVHADLTANPKGIETFRTWIHTWTLSSQKTGGSSLKISISGRASDEASSNRSSAGSGALRLLFDLDFARDH